jgi:UDP-GlcNAc3NAcA epimerase
MRKIKVATIVGARPQFIKAAVVSRALLNSKLSEVIIHTGQHYSSNMSRIFFDEMNIPEPKYNLNVKEDLQGAMTAKMIIGMEKVFLEEKPSLAIVYGDTNSTLAASLAASKLQIPVCHIEAGLRSFNMKMPEEINRIITDRVSSLLCCPTIQALRNLQQEGYHLNAFYSIHHTGDVMYDAANYYYGKSDNKILSRYNLQEDNFILSTIHRAENTNDTTKLEKLVESLNLINTKKKVVLPLHPRTAALIDSLNVKPLFTIIEPVGYFEMLTLLHNCRLVITDSGGLQKESYFFNKPCVIIREETEWVELTDNGYATLAGTDKERINNAVEKYHNFSFVKKEALYGNGNAGQEIVSILENYMLN